MLYEVITDSSLFNTLDGNDIENFDKEYSYENFCYAFESDDGNSTFAIIINKKINILSESDFKALQVKPVNLKQKLFMKAILTKMFDLLVIDAKAGSGKTLMSRITSYNVCYTKLLRNLEIKI